mgnify:FL=1
MNGAGRTGAGRIALHSRFAGCRAVGHGVSENCEAVPPRQLSQTRVPRPVSCAPLLTATRALAVLVLFATTAGHAQTSESTLITRLDAIAADIAAAEAERAKSQRAVDQALGALGKVEREIAASNQRLRELDAGVAELEAKIVEIDAERVRTDAALAEEKTALAALLQSAYALGGLDTLKLVLAQDQLADTGRLLAYQTQLNRVRVTRIDRVRDLLAQLDSLRAQSEMQKSALAALSAEQAERVAALAAQRRERANALAAVRRALDQVDARIAVLEEDRAGVEDLLKKLRDVIGDVPALLPDDRPFQSLRGKLGRPLQGAVVSAYGAELAGGRRSPGMTIAAARGADIRAVARGRVAFADWLRGYGLLLILDHGGGYMSLYGRCDALNFSEGDWVDAGTVIAAVGDSGAAAAPGLYFELRHQGQALDPKEWLAP